MIFNVEKRISMKNDRFGILNGIYIEFEENEKLYNFIFNEIISKKSYGEEITVQKLLNILKDNGFDIKINYNKDFKKSYINKSFYLISISNYNKINFVDIGYRDYLSLDRATKDSLSSSVQVQSNNEKSIYTAFKENFKLFSYI